MRLPEPPILLAEFESDGAKDGHIDLHREGDMSSFLSVRYLNNSESGEITAEMKTCHLHDANQCDHL